MLTFPALLHLVASGALVVLAATSSTKSTQRPLLSDDTLVALPVLISDKSEGTPTEEQPLSPRSEESPLTHPSSLVPRARQKISQAPRQAILFEVLRDGWAIPGHFYDNTVPFIISSDMTKLLISRTSEGTLRTKLFELDFDKTQDPSTSRNLETFDSTAIAVSNNGKFTIRIGDNPKTLAKNSTILYLNRNTVLLRGDFDQGDGKMEASFSPDSSRVLLRSPSRALHLWEAFEDGVKDQLARHWEISLEARAAAIGDNTLAYVAGGYLYVHKLDFDDRTPILKTNVRNFDDVNKMAICGDRIGLIQGKRFSSYNLNDTMHAYNYTIDIHGQQVTSLAFHETHLALVGPESRLYVYDLNDPLKGKRTEEDMANIILSGGTQFMGVRDTDSESFEALGYDPAEGNGVYFGKHRILLKPVPKEEDISMSSLLPSVAWSIVGLYLPGPQIYHQISGTFPHTEPEEEVPVEQSLAPMRELIEKSFKGLPLVLTVKEHSAYLVAPHGSNPENATPYLFRFDSLTKSSHPLVPIPATLTISTLYASRDSRRFVLFAGDGTVYLVSSKKGTLREVTAFKHGTNTCVYLHPFQPLTFIYHNDALYIFDDSSEEPERVALFRYKVESVEAPVTTVSARFDEQELIVTRSSKKHRLTYANVLPDN